MTSATVALRAARVRVAVRPDVIAVAGLALYTAVLAIATWGTWGDLDSDTGYDIVAGARVADGELPYKDFVYYYGPLSPFLSGIAALAGGPGLWPAVGLGFVIAIAIIAATYALARAAVEPPGAFLAAALTAAVAFIPSNYSFVLPHTNAATLGALALLGLLICLWRYSETERSRWAVVAGTCAGLLLLTKPEPALAGLLAVAAWSIVRARRHQGVRHPLALGAGPAIAIPGAVYGAFLVLVSPQTLLFENLWPLDELRAGGDTLIEARMPLTGASFLELAKMSALYAAGVAALLLLAHLLDRADTYRRPLLGAVVLGGVIFAAACVAKPDGLRDGVYYAYGWIPVGAALAVVVLARRVERGDGSAGTQAQLAGAVALTVLAATTYNGFVVHGWRPTMSVYYIPLAAILIARLFLVEIARTRTAYVLGLVWVSFLVAAGTGLTLKDAQGESATVRGPGGALAERPAEAALYQGALDEIAARTSPGEPILVAPLMTGLYPLSGHQSPLDKISMLPGALPDASDQLAAIARLEQADVRLIVTDRREWPGYGHTSFGGSFDRLLAGWIERHFDHVRTLTASGDSTRTLDIWLKRGTR
jgi:hypothetical protein